MVTINPAALQLRISRAQFRFLIGIAFVAMVMVIPWENLRGGFTDLARYRNNFELGIYSIDTDSGVLGWWRSEALWRQIVYSRLAAGWSVDSVFWLASIVGLAGSTFYVLRRSPNAAAILLLINPSFIDLAFSQVRSGLAAGIVYIGFLVIQKRSLAGRIGGASLLILALFLHQFAAALVLLGLSFMLVQRLPLSTRFKAAALAVASIVMILAFTGLKQVILSAVADRRMGQETESGGVLLTFLLFSATLPAWRQILKVTQNFDVYFVASLSALILGLFLTESYGVSRVFAIALPALIVATAQSQNAKDRLLGYSIVAGTNSLYWAFWFLAG